MSPRRSEDRSKRTHNRDKVIGSNVGLDVMVKCDVSNCRMRDSAGLQRRANFEQSFLFGVGDRIRQADGGRYVGMDVVGQVDVG